MLSKEENELLTRVGPGTAMGALLRQYWHPVLYSYEIPEPDGTPVRVRLLGEDLIAFRNTDGVVGLLGARCPHRGAELFFGRNEGNGLRCVYHGWKFDLHGNCLEMPNEPPESRFERKVRHTSYPCREMGGVIWTYMGDGEPPALALPEWAHVPDSHRFMTKRYHECNWAQALEGDLDSSHVGFLHAELDKTVPAFGYDESTGNFNFLGHNQSPHLEAQETDFGLWVAARRPSTRDDHFYWRATALLFPYFVMIPPSGDAPIHVNLWQPMDDLNTMVWSIQYHGARALSAAEREELGSGLYEHFGPDDTAPVTDEAGGAWRSKANRSNDFLVDRQAQKTQSFTGLRGFWRQDRAVVESMGRIFDRSTEYLGSADVGVIRFRKLYMEAARAFARNGSLPGSRDPEAFSIRPVGANLPVGANWPEKIGELAVARPGTWMPGA